MLIEGTLTGPQPRNWEQYFAVASDPVHELSVLYLKMCPHLLQTHHQSFSKKVVYFFLIDSFFVVEFPL
jgi:hypothetical protein